MQTKRSLFPRAVKTLSYLTILTLAIFHHSATAQQMIIDDAEVTTYRSFQVETWYGTRESWVLAAVSPVQGLELGTGIGLESREGMDPANWILEAKYAPMDLEEKGWAAGLTTGLLYNFDGDLEEVYAYIPFSRLILNNSSLLHLNIGFDALNEAEWEYEFFTGIRGDFGVTDRVSILSEIAASNFADLFYQAGFRFTLIPELLEMDITYGEGFRRMETAPGFNIGVAITPDSLW